MLSIREALKQLPDLNIAELAKVIDSYDRRSSRESSKPISNKIYRMGDLEVEFKNHETIVVGIIK